MKPFNALDFIRRLQRVRDGHSKFCPKMFLLVVLYAVVYGGT